MLASIRETLSGARDVVRKLIPGYSPSQEPTSPESKTPASSSTAVIIRQSSDKDAKTEEEKESAIDYMTNSLKLMIIGYLIDLQSLKEQDQIPPQLPKGTNSFLVMLIAHYTQHIAHNLLQHTNLDDTLVLARMNRACLCQVTMAKDSYNWTIEATILQMMKAIGNRNKRKTRRGEKHFGMVESIFELFEDNPEMCALLQKQFDAWPLDEKASEETLEPYVAATETFCQKVIKNEDKKIPGKRLVITNAAFQELLKIPIAEEFEKTFKQPRPGYVVRSGFLSIIALYPKFLAIRKKYLDQLGEFSVKDDLFSGKFLLVFQSMLPRCDLVESNLFYNGYSCLTWPGVKRGSFWISRQTLFQNLYQTKTSAIDLRRTWWPSL